MVNKDTTFGAMSRQRKSSLPIVIPTNNKSSYSNNPHKDAVKVKNTRHVADEYYGDNDDDEDNYDGDNDDFTTFQAPSIETSPIPKYARNMIQKNRKTSVIFSSKPSTFFNNVKKKKSSSGVSSSSSDNNFPLHNLSDRDEKAFEDDRKISDISIEELSSNESSPAVSRRSSAKKLSETQKEDLGYSSMREKTVPKNTSAYHLNLTNKLKESTSKKIGLWNEKINTQQKIDSLNRSIYSLDGGQRRRSKKISSNVPQRNLEEEPRLFSRRNTDSFVTGYEEKLKSPDLVRNKSRRSLSEKVSSFFGGKKKSQDQSNVIIPKKRSSTVVAPEPEKVEEQVVVVVEEDQPRSRKPSRKISQNLQITPQQVTQLRKCSRSSKENEERKLSFAEIQRKFSSTVNPPFRHRGNLVDQSTQTCESTQDSKTDSRASDFKKYSAQEISASPSLRTRRSSLPVTMGFTRTQSPFEHEGFTPFEPYSTITEYGEQPIPPVATRSKSACRCNFEPGTENMFIEQIRKQSNNNPNSNNNNNNNNNMQNQTVLEEDLNFDNDPMIDQEYEEGFDVFDKKNENTSDDSASLPSWQKQSMAALATVEKTRRLSLNPPPTQPPTKKPLRRNKSHDIKRKLSMSHSISNPPWYQSEMPITPDIRIDALSATTQSVDEASLCQSMSEGYDDQPTKISVIHRPNLSQLTFEDDHEFNHDNRSFHTLEDLKNIRRLSKTNDIEYDESDSDEMDDDDFEDQFEQYSDNDEIRTEESQPVVEYKITEPQQTNQRRRKFGVMHLHALDNLPQRRRSVYQRDMNQDMSNSLDFLDPSGGNSFGRKMSTAFGTIAHPFLQFDKSDDIEIVSDQNTLNVIVDSYDALNMDIDIASGTSYISQVPQIPDNTVIKSNFVLFHRNHLDNLDEEEQEAMTSSSTITTPSTRNSNVVQPTSPNINSPQPPQLDEDEFENAVGFLERKKREMLRTSASTKEHVDSPKSRRKGKHLCISCLVYFRACKMSVFYLY